jgi:hypothetical protein
VGTVNTSNNEQRALKREMERDSEPQHKEFSEAEIKQRLKNNSKGDLIKIIINLSKRIDEQKAHTNEIKNKVQKLYNENWIDDIQVYNELLSTIKREV